jgi:hypothetical protein
MTKRDWLRIGILATVVVLSVAVNPRTAEAGSTVYIAGSGNEFGTIDLTTGVFTSIGTLALPGGDAMYGMGFGSDGNLYGLDSQTPGSHLWQIDPTNAHVTDLGSVGQSAIDATADASGKMYALSQDASAIYYTFNPPSTATNVIGPTGILSAGLMAVTADGGQLFTSVANFTGGPYDLAGINPTTGMATIIGNTGFFVINGLFVKGTLYGFDFNTDAIVTINTSTGAGTLVATYSLPSGDAIFASATPAAQIGVPEPSGLTLGLVSVVLMGSFGLIRHRCRPSTLAGPRGD